MRCCCWASMSLPCNLCKLQVQTRPSAPSHVHRSSSPLTNAAANGQREACDLLLQLKADISKMGYNNRTPLQWAVDRNHTSTADFLRQRGGC